MRNTLVAGLALIALAACSQATTQTEAPAAETPVVATTTPCAAFAVIAPGETACGVSLSADAVLTLDGQPQFNGAPLIVTSGVERRASSLMVYPSPGGRHIYVRGCEGPKDEPGICWRNIILDRQGEARDFTVRSHYGPSREIYWSPDNSRFAIVEPMEGFEALTLVNPATGALSSSPQEGGVNNWKVDESSITWTSPTTVTAQVEVCNGDTGRCAPAAEQTVTAP